MDKRCCRVYHADNIYYVSLMRCNLVALCFDCINVVYDAMLRERTPLVESTFASLAPASVSNMDIEDEDIPHLHREYSMPNLRVP